MPAHESAPAERYSGLRESLAAHSAAAEPGSRHAALVLLDGVAMALAIEADGALDPEVGLRLTYLMADVFDAADELEAAA